MEANTYVDLYLLPVYQAEAVGAVAREHGALSVASSSPTRRREPDGPDGLVMKDPRVEELDQGDPPADMDRMRYGGFAPLVTA